MIAVVHCRQRVVASICLILSNLEPPSQSVKEGLSFLTFRTGLTLFSIDERTASYAEEKKLEPDRNHYPPENRPLPRTQWSHLSDEEKARRNLNSWITAGILFSLTLLSTFAVGTFMVRSNINSPLDFLDGWVFAVPLIAILLFHESGHYLLARRHGVDVSPPYFIPFPNIIGTMGAFISIRSRIQNRRVLLDIAAAGPVAGLLPSLVALIIGYQLSTIEQMVVTQDTLVFGDSALTLWIQNAVIGPVPEGYAVWIHPMGLAGWVGLFVTMLNLLPFGQLDGGHITFALAGKRQWLVAPLFLICLPVLGLLVNLWWFVLLLFFLLISIIAVTVSRLVYRSNISLIDFWKNMLIKHPPVLDEEPLDPVRRVVGWFCVVIFLLCFIPDPLRVLSPAG